MDIAARNLVRVTAMISDQSPNTESTVASDKAAEGVNPLTGGD